MTNYPFTNPYIQTALQTPVQIPQFNLQYQQPQPVQKKLPRVHGLEGANAFPMAPDSEEIALDIDVNKNIEYLMVTDSAGYKTVVPFVITPYKQEEPLTTADLDTRLQSITNELSQLKERMTKYESDKSDTQRD